MKNTARKIIVGIILAILLSIQTTSFSQTIFKLPYTPRDVVFSDYDLDGDNDILVSCPSSDTVVILRNTGFGGLERIDLPLTSAVVFKLSLINNDEYPDIVTAYYYYLNNGTGGFEETSIPIPHNHENIRFEDVVDMDMNGSPDIIYYAFLPPYGWGIIYNNGDESFTDVFTHQSEDAEYPKIDFLNNDDSPDILLSSVNTQPGNYIAYNYDPNYMFDTLCDNSGGWVHNNIIDIDSDGDKDILFSNMALSQVHEYLFYENIKDENFINKGFITKKPGTRIDVISDLDGDGFPDIACISRYDGGSNTDSIYVLKNNQSNGFALLDQVYIGEVGSMTEHIYSGDLNGDGLDELFITGYMNPTGSHIRILWNDGTGHFVDTNIVSTEFHIKNTSNIELYPNPFKNKINFRINNFKANEIIVNIYNLSGELIYNKTTYRTNTISWNGLFDNDLECPAGLYVASILLDQKEHINVKFVKY